MIYNKKRLAALAILSIFFFTSFTTASSIVTVESKDSKNTNKNYTKTAITADIYVDDDANLSWYDSTHVKTIQEGVKNATSGDTIFVYNGTYYGEILINKTINLIGENRNNAIINGVDNQGRIISIMADFVNVSGFTLQKSENPFEIEGAVYLLSKYNIIENNIIKNNAVGIRFRYWKQLDTKPEFNKVHNNTFQNNFGFIILSDSSNNIIENNILIGSSNSRIGGSNNNTMSNNKVINNESCTYFIWDSHNNTISNNFLISNSFNDAIYFENCNNNSIHHNYIRSVLGRGIIIENSSFNNIHHNNFAKCLFKARFLKSENNIWDNNYWGKSRILPKPIFGRIGKNGLIPWVNFDRHPAKEPNEI